MSTQHFSVKDFSILKQQVLNWTKQFSTFCLLDNHQYQLHPHSEECLLGAGVRKKLSVSAGNALPALKKFMSTSSGWLFGHLGYELKNEMEELSSSHRDPVGFADCYFFEPAIVVRLRTDTMIIEADDPEEIYNRIIRTEISTTDISYAEPVIRSRYSQPEYLHSIRQLQQHILRGDCYEINFCQEFYAEHTRIDPVAVYQRLSGISPNPFSALYRTSDQWLLCASPERFLKKEGNQVISQPIKGTSRRVTDDPDNDEKDRRLLHNSAKDRSENVMIVDLVRNDLSRICEEGSVVVDELYGIYTFPQVHQMISTIRGTLRTDVDFTDIIKACFPMGSMTGAPKKRVMQLIEQYERSRRGLFSGAVGYINPEGDFDFNVVIRSILYNASTGYLSLPAGSGITFYSDAEKEWDECMMKMAAMKRALKHTP